MALSRDDVARIAELARLEIPPDRIERVAEQLSQALDFAATLKRLDLRNCVPTPFAPSGAPLRADVPDGRRLPSEVALAAAPDAEDGFFQVPPVVEHLDP